MLGERKLLNTLQGDKMKNPAAIPDFSVGVLIIFL
jgi:hypothetical protein